MQYGCCDGSPVMRCGCAHMVKHYVYCIVIPCGCRQTSSSFINIASMAAVKHAKDEPSLMEQYIAALVEMKDEAEAEEHDEPEILED